MSSKSIKDILDQQYVTVDDLRIVIPEMSYAEALKLIKSVRETMNSENYYVPECRKLLALTWMVKKKLGIK